MSETSPDDFEELNTIEEIAPDGDFILVVDSEKHKMRVSSTLLAHASPVFKAMFGRQFREGQALRDSSNSSPLELPLPDDDWLTMSVTCKMAHLNCGPREGLRDPRNLYRLAVCIDKYCCAAQLRLQSSALLLTCLHCYDPNAMENDDLWYLAGAAYMMDCSQAFKIATSKLILDTSGAFYLRSFDRIPGTIIGDICEKRAAAWRMFCRELPALGVPNCGYACENEDQAFMQSLADAFHLMHWPPNFEDRTLSSLLSTTRRLSTLSRSQASCKHSKAITTITNRDFFEAAQKIEQVCQGLCLECAKSGAGDPNRPCVAHKWNS